MQRQNFYLFFDVFLIGVITLIILNVCGLKMGNTFNKIVLARSSLCCSRSSVYI